MNYFTFVNKCVTQCCIIYSLVPVKLSISNIIWNKQWSEIPITIYTLSSNKKKIYIYISIEWLWGIWITYLTFTSTNNYQIGCYLDTILSFNDIWFFFFFFFFFFSFFFFFFCMPFSVRVGVLSLRRGLQVHWFCEFRYSFKRNEFSMINIFLFRYFIIKI